MFEIICFVLSVLHGRLKILLVSALKLKSVLVFKLGSLKQQIYLLIAWRPKVQNEGAVGHALSQGCKADFVTCLSQLLVSPGIPWLVEASCQFLSPLSLASSSVCQIFPVYLK